VDRKINTRVERQDGTRAERVLPQREAEAIQKIGRGEKSEIDELKKKIDSAGMSKEVHEKAIQELKRLELMPPMSRGIDGEPDYLDWLLAVPWRKVQGNSRYLAAERF